MKRHQARICGCGRKIPKHISIDGKKRNLQNRTKCLECLPFGKRTCSSPKERRARKAASLRRSYYAFKMANGIDLITARRNYRKQLVYDLVGGGCQVCGYRRCLRNLEFHHIRDKHINVDSRTFQFAYQKVMDELAKCIAVCNRCHGEIHDNLIACDIVTMNKQLTDGLPSITKAMWVDRRAIIAYINRRA